MNIVIEYDSSVSKAPAGFKTAVQAAVTFLDHAFSNPITVPIMFSYGEIDGSRLSLDALGESSTNGNIESYSSLVSLLTAAATSPADFESLAALPATDPTDGGRFWVSDAQAQIFGLGSEPGYIDPEDGFVGLSSSADFTYSPTDRSVSGAYDAIGVLEHEITEAIGRIGYLGDSSFEGYTLYTPLDLFRYSSAGVHELTQAAGYFSVDGQHMLLPYNNPQNGGDADDWASSVSGDAFDASSAPSTAEYVSPTDLREMDVIGYTIAPATAMDFNGDGASGVLFGAGDGTFTGWELTDNAVTDDGVIGNPGAGWRLVGTGDFNGDLTTDLLFQQTGGDLSIWELYDTNVISKTTIVGASGPQNPGSGWTVVGTGDFNGDGMADVLFRNVDGDFSIWDVNGDVVSNGVNEGAQIIGGGVIGSPGPSWMFKGVGDFNGDGTSDILLENTSGSYVVWLITDNQVTGGGTIGSPGPGWLFAGIGDFTGDGKSDILFRDAAGDYTSWDMSGDQVVGGGFIGNPGVGWSLVGIGDYNGDGKSDLMFRNASGALSIWDLNDTQIIGGATLTGAGSSVTVDGGLGQPQTFPALFLENTNGTLSTWEMNGDQIVGGGTLGAPGVGFTAEAIGDFNGDGERGVAFQSATGTVSIWLTDGAHVIGGAALGAPGAGWSLIGSGDFNGDGSSDLLFRDAAGDLTTWDLNGANIVGGGFIGNPGANEIYEGIGDFNGDGKADILFKNTVTGDYSIWLMNDNHIVGSGQIGAPGAGWSFAGIGDLNGDGKADILFQNAAGDLSSWDMNGTQVVGGGFIGAPGPGWSFQELIDLNGDGKADIIFSDAAGDLTSWLMNGTAVVGGGFIGNPGPGWHLFG